jgi:hypothetical protein
MQSDETAGAGQSTRPPPLSAGGSVAGAGGGPLAFTFGHWFTWTATGIALPALGLYLAAVSGPLAAGAYESLPVLAATHAATLGWATMTIMGAAMQMGPVLLGGRVKGERTIPGQYALFTAGVLAIIVGFARGAFALVAAGGVGVNIASWWFLALVISTILSAGPRRSVVSPHIPAAFLCFILVLLWGTTLAANLRWGFWPALLLGHRGLVVHLALGLGGWLGLMVVGTFYRLVPLVHGARVADPRRGWAVLACATLAITSVIAGVFTGNAALFRAAALLAAGGLVLFCTEVLHVLAHRRSRAPDLNVAHWHGVVASSGVLAGAAAAWGLGWLRGDPERFSEGIAVLFLLGWVGQAILGQLYKVTPFLMWYYRATIPDVLAIPRQPAPYNPRPGRVALVLSNAGVACLVGGIWAGSSGLAVVGAALWAVAAVIVAYMLAYRWIPPAISRALIFEWRWRIS